MHRDRTPEQRACKKRRICSTRILFGIVCGVICSYVLKQFQNDTYAEITITMILAHATFLGAERLNQQSLWWVSLHVSGIIATAFAAIIMGNFGKTKISPKGRTTYGIILVIFFLRM
jgi:NhaP-type Na+/H+ or K+/H+ antiporter